MKFFEISGNSLSRETRTTGLRERHRARCMASKGSKRCADWRELACNISVVSGTTTSKQEAITFMSSSICSNEYRFFLLRRYLSSRRVVKEIKPSISPRFTSRCFMILYGAVRSSRPDFVSVSLTSQFTITSVSKSILFEVLYSLTLSYIVVLSFLMNSVDDSSWGITSRYLPSRYSGIFFIATIFCGDNCLVESIAFFRRVDILVPPYLNLNYNK